MIGRLSPRYNGLPLAVTVDMERNLVGVNYTDWTHVYDSATGAIVDEFYGPLALGIELHPSTRKIYLAVWGPATPGPSGGGGIYVYDHDDAAPVSTISTPDGETLYRPPAGNDVVTGTVTDDHSGVSYVSVSFKPQDILATLLGGAGLSGGHDHLRGCVPADVFMVGATAGPAGNVPGGGAGNRPGRQHRA